MKVGSTNTTIAVILTNHTFANSIFFFSTLTDWTRSCEPPNAPTPSNTPTFFRKGRGRNLYILVPWCKLYGCEHYYRHRNGRMCRKKCFHQKKRRFLSTKADKSIVEHACTGNWFIIIPGRKNGMHPCLSLLMDCSKHICNLERWDVRASLSLPCANLSWFQDLSTVSWWSLYAVAVSRLLFTVLSKTVTNGFGQIGWPMSERFVWYSTTLYNKWLETTRIIEYCLVLRALLSFYRSDLCVMDT